MPRRARSSGPGRGAARGGEPGWPGPRSRGRQHARSRRGQDAPRVVGLGLGRRPRDSRGRGRRQAGLHARGGPGCCRGTWRIRPRSGNRRAVHATRSPWRRRHGHRLSGRAIPAGQAAGGPEADQGRHGLADRPGAVRRRTPGAGPDGPPQHRPRLRRRRHRGQSAVLRDGVGPRRPDHRLLRPAPTVRSTPGSSSSSPFVRRSSTPTRRGSSIATSSPRT